MEQQKQQPASTTPAATMTNVVADEPAELKGLSLNTRRTALLTIGMAGSGKTTFVSVRASVEGRQAVLLLLLSCLWF